MSIDSLVRIKSVFNKCPPSVLVSICIAHYHPKHSPCRLVYPHGHGYRSAHFVDDKIEVQ